MYVGPDFCSFLHALGTSRFLLLGPRGCHFGGLMPPRPLELLITQRFVIQIVPSGVRFFLYLTRFACFVIALADRPQLLLDMRFFVVDALGMFFLAFH